MTNTLGGFSTSRLFVLQCFAVRTGVFVKCSGLAAINVSKIALCVTPQRVGLVNHVGNDLTMGLVAVLMTLFPFHGPA